MIALAELDTVHANLMAQAQQIGRIVAGLREAAIPASIYDPAYGAMITERADELQAQYAELWDRAQAIATTSSFESHVGLAAKWVAA